MLSVIKHPKQEEASQGRPKWEVADIFCEYGQAYRSKHPLPPGHLKVMHDIEVCRTAYLGGHIEQCDSCGFERNAYNSCRNRHCPKCQALAKARWLEARMAELLPVTYFHNIFTLPHKINPIALCNKKVIFDILFKSVSETLLQFGRNPKNGLGGKLGLIAILHTWDQTLLDHFHLHCLIPGGVLSFDGSTWIAGRENFLFRVELLSVVFQGKFIDNLEKAFEKGKLIFPGKTEPLGTPKGFKGLKNQLWAKNWVVYSKPPFAGPEQVLDYLGRYTHRVAISNHRIVAVENGKVTFHYRDRKDNATLKVMTLEADEFMRRFLLHIVPNGFMRIRHFGFLANRRKKKDLSRCRELLGLSAHLPKADTKTTQEFMLELTGIDLNKCPYCKKGTMKFIAEIPQYSRVSFNDLVHQPHIWDSS
jgi:hypothetical protein